MSSVVSLSPARDSNGAEDLAKLHGGSAPGHAKGHVDVLLHNDGGQALQADAVECGIDVPVHGRRQHAICRWSNFGIGLRRLPFRVELDCPAVERSVIRGLPTPAPREDGIDELCRDRHVGEQPLEARVLV